MRITIGYLGLAAYLLVSLGIMFIPVTGRSIHAATDERYPCENCSCGCSSAEQCWSHCCCYTMEERLEWALRNDVVPPAPYDALFREYKKNHSRPESCCADKHHHAETCCSADKPSCGTHDSPANVRGRGGLIAWGVKSLTPAECRGLFLRVITVAVVAPTIIPAKVLMHEPRVQSLLIVNDESACHEWWGMVPTPPPRTA